VTNLRRALLALVSTWRGRFILVFLIAQMVIPLQYYVLRRDAHDERFAWRMFSPMRMAVCEPSVSIDNQRINLLAEFHEAWLELVQRGRVEVIQRMAQKLCRTHPGKAVDFTIQCKYLDRPNATFGNADVCTKPFL
jgi:hypothetical protein